MLICEGSGRYGENKEVLLITFTGVRGSNNKGVRRDESPSSWETKGRSISLSQET
jgi:hypothetical protein